MQLQAISVGSSSLTAPVTDAKRASLGLGAISGPAPARTGGGAQPDAQAQRTTLIKQIAQLTQRLEQMKKRWAEIMAAEIAAQRESFKRF